MYLCMLQEAPSCSKILDIDRDVQRLSVLLNIRTRSKSVLIELQWQMLGGFATIQCAQADRRKASK